MVRNREQRARAVALRRKGLTYGEITAIIGEVPKGTLSHWMQSVTIPKTVRARMDRRILKKLARARRTGQEILKEQRREYFSNLRQANKPLAPLLENPNIAKLTLATLYLAEGSKGRSCVCFGNSDPGIIGFFLHLLRFCYKIDESKFRCTVQGRSDQSAELLERFWGRITRIPHSQFYAFRADSRSQGKRTMKKDYRGVCRIDYLSAAVYHDLMVMGQLITMGR